MVFLIRPDSIRFLYSMSERISTLFFLFLYHMPILVSLNQSVILDFISFQKSFPTSFQSSTFVWMKIMMVIAPKKRMKRVVKMVSIIVVFLFVSFSNTKIIQFSGLSKFFCNFFQFLFRRSPSSVVRRFQNQSPYITSYIITDDNHRIIPVDFRTPIPGYCKIDHICNGVIEPAQDEQWDTKQYGKE